MTCQPNWLFTGSPISPVSSAKATSSNSGTKLPRSSVSFPPSSGRAGVRGVLLRQLREVGAVLELLVDVVGFLLRLDEDVGNLAGSRAS